MSEKLHRDESDDWKKWLTEMPKIERTPDESSEHEIPQQVELDLDLLPTPQAQKFHFGINLSEFIDQPLVVSTSFGTLTGTLIHVEKDYLVLVEVTGSNVLIPYRRIELILTN